MTDLNDYPSDRWLIRACHEPVGYTKYSVLINLFLMTNKTRMCISISSRVLGEWQNVTARTLTMRVQCSRSDELKTASWNVVNVSKKAIRRERGPLTSAACRHSTLGFLSPKTTSYLLPSRPLWLTTVTRSSVFSVSPTDQPTRINSNADTHPRVGLIRTLVITRI